MKLQQLRSEIEEIHKIWRSLHYFVESAEFKYVYDRSTESERKKLVEIARSGDHVKFKKMVRHKRQALDPFEKLGIRKLQAIAKYLNLRGWYDMNKVTLVEEIRNEIDRIKADSNEVISKSEG